MEEKKLRGLEWEPQVKQTALLASPIYIVQAQGEEKKHVKRGAKIEPLLWGQPALTPWRCTFLYLPNKTLSCNRILTLVHCFKPLLQWDRHEEITHSPNIWSRDSDLTWLKQPQLSPGEVETKHSRSPIWWKLSWWKLNEVETLCSGSDEKPIVLETRLAKTNSAESTSLSLRFQKTSS